MVSDIESVFNFTLYVCIIITSAMAEVRSIAMRVSVCLSVCLYVSVHSHVSKATCPNFVKLSVHVTMAVGIMFSHNGPLMGHIACGVGIN